MGFPQGQLFQELVSRIVNAEALSSVLQTVHQVLRLLTLSIRTEPLGATRRGSDVFTSSKGHPPTVVAATQLLQSPVHHDEIQDHAWNNIWIHSTSLRRVSPGTTNYEDSHMAEPGCRLHVGNMPYLAKDEDLRIFFCWLQCRVDIHTHKPSNKPKCWLRVREFAKCAGCTNGCPEALR